MAVRLWVPKRYVRPLRLPAKASATPTATRPSRSHTEVGESNTIAITTARAIPTATMRMFRAVLDMCILLPSAVGDKRRKLSQYARACDRNPTCRPRHAHWIDQDCHQPPSLPKTTYRAPRGYGVTTSRPNQQSIDRHRRSTTWFARNRHGGRVILYHRHLGPVLFRDWSTPQDLFTDTVAASADTSTSRNSATGNDAPEPITAEYQRPFPAPSEHLAVATNPELRTTNKVIP